MKENKISYLKILILLLSIQSFAQSITTKGPVINMNPDLFGYNDSRWFKGVDWSNPNFQDAVERLNPANLRYGGGTTANYFDWRTGTIMKTINKGFPKYFGDEFAADPEEFVNSIPENTEIVYCINMARPTPITGISPYASDTVLKNFETLQAKTRDILEGIQAFEDAGHPLKYVELGNEFYIGAPGEVEKQGAIYSGNPDLYIAHANYIANQIHKKYPNIKMAIIGEDQRSNNQPTAWTQKIYDAIENGDLNHIDAITFHWYSGPGTSKLTNIQDAKNSLRQTFRRRNGTLEKDLKNIPDGLDIWVTEYNTFSQPDESDDPNNPGFGGPIQGSWINAMFASNLTLFYTLFGEKIQILNIHAISLTNTQWKALESESTLSGNGTAWSMVGEAMKGKTKVQELSFNNIPEPTFNNCCASLIGAKFWNEDQTSVLIINNTENEKKSVNIKSLFSGSGNITLSQYFDPTPFDRNISEDANIDYIYNDNLQNTVTIPPFSITVISQENENLIADSSFERNNNSWITDDPIHTSRKNAKTGRKSLLLERVSKGWRSGKQKVSLKENTTYEISAESKTKLTSGSSRLVVKFFDNLDKELSSPVVSNILTGTSTYKNLAATFTTPQNTAYALVFVQLANGRGKVWFDDIILKSFGNSSSSAELSGNFYIKNKATGLLLDGDVDRTVELAEKPSLSKNWKLIKQSESVYKIKNIKYENYIDVDRVTEVSLDDDFKGVDRNWVFKKSNDDYYFIKNQETQTLLSANVTGDLKLTKNTADLEKWELVPVDHFKINESADPSFLIYPNPVKGSLNVRILDENFENLTQVKVIDVQGRVVRSIDASDFNKTSGNTIKLETSKLLAGNYFISLYFDSEKKQTKMFTVQN